MRKVYSCSSVIELSPYQFALDAAGIKYLIKNEFSQGATGEIPATESWPQLWVIDEQDFEKAQQLCTSVEAEQKQNNADWQCSNCNEINASSFEYCWQCQTIRRED